VILDSTLQQAIVDDYYDEILSRFLEWVQGQKSVRAVIQVGSRAREDLPADEWADLDLILFVTDPGAFLADTTWLEAIEPVWIVIPWHTAAGEAELLVMFEGGYNVDFVICPAEILRHPPKRNGNGSALSRGARVLLDRDGRAARHIPPVFGPPARRAPGDAEFARICDSFWYTAVYVARQLARGELWLAKVRDADLKRLLLTMLEWHAGMRSHWQRDTWHDGRRIETWADPGALDRLNALFGGYGRDSASAALLATIQLFRRIGPETAAGLGYAYPFKTESRCMGLIHEAIP
jgi:aminoglycoside 6-adenylyltransferase